MDTGVAPREARIEPNPIFMIIIWITWSFAAMVLIKATMRDIDPVSSMIVIWSIDVPTIIVIGKEAKNPAMLDFKMMVIDVWKKKKAMPETNNHPINPARSAGSLFHKSRTRINNIGNNASKIENNSICSPLMNANQVYNGFPKGTIRNTIKRNIK